MAFSLFAMALRVAIVAGLAALYGGAVGLPVDLASIANLGDSISFFWIVAGLLILSAPLYGATAVGQGHFEATAVRKTVLAMAAREGGEIADWHAGEIGDLSRITFPFTLFIAVRLSVSMVPSIGQVLVGLLWVFVLSPALGWLICIFVLVATAIAQAAAKRNSTMTRSLSDSPEVGHSEDEEEGTTGGGLDRKLRNFLTERRKTSKGAVAESEILGWLQSQDVASWFELRKTWRQAGIRGNSFAFAALVSVAVMPAVLLEIGLIAGSVLDLAAIIGVVIVMVQAIASLSGSVAGLGRFHYVLVDFRADWKRGGRSDK